MRMALGLLMMAASLVAQAAGCNCQKITGACLGSIEFVKSFGRKPSYGAEIVVHSSEKRCSKVEYFIDNTPNETILINRSSESESLFGTSPITEKNITFSSCKICASESDGEISNAQENGMETQRNSGSGKITLDPQLRSFTFTGYCTGCTNIDESIPLGRMIADQLQGLQGLHADVQISLERFQPEFSEAANDTGTLTNDLAIRVDFGSRTAVISNSQRGFSFNKHSGKDAYIRARTASVQQDVLDVVRQLQNMLAR